MGQEIKTGLKAAKILLLEGIHPVAQQILQERGFEVDLHSSAMSEEELKAQLPRYQAIGIRSKTQLTRSALQTAPDLWVIGTFCIGTNQVDLKTANLQGVPVFNAPYSNTRSVAELVIGEMIVLSRQLGDRSRQAHQGQWAKSAKGSHEIRGKTLGIVGYGHIGSQVSILAEAMGMKVCFYDVVTKLPLGNAQPCESLKELLAMSDFVTLHVPATEQTKNMMGVKELAQMKKGSYLLNASRGSVVDIEALAQALREKNVGGTAVDVFPEEPKNNNEPFQSPLQGLENVILTPHIGGSTEEAQEAIGREVADSLSRYLLTGSTYGNVNFPVLEPPAHSADTLLMNVHKNVPGVLGEINGIVSEFGMNIKSQSLSTDENVGYLMMSLEGEQGSVVAQKVSELSTSIKTRVQ